MPWTPARDSSGNCVNTRPIRVKFYGSGAITSGWDYNGPTGGGKRGKIRGCSFKARERFAWLLTHSPIQWGATTLLTFQWQPKHLKDALEKFVRRVRIELPGMLYAWWMESQERGVVHFHFLWDRAWLDSKGWLDHGYITTLGTGDAARTVLRGPLDDFAAATWIRCVGNPSPKFRAFQMGGTSEPVRDSGGLALYPWREATKARQLEIPKGFTTPGRWWFLSRKAYPEQTREVLVTEWPYPTVRKYVHDAEALYGVSWDYVPEALTPSPESVESDDIPF